MDPAIAALVGAGIGAVAAIAGQTLAHRFAVGRDHAQHTRTVVDESVAAALDAIMIADGFRISAADRITVDHRRQLHDSIRRVSASLARLQTSLGNEHPIPHAYDALDSTVLNLAYLILAKDAKDTASVDALAVKAREELRRYQVVTRGIRRATDSTPLATDGNQDDVKRGDTQRGPGLRSI